MEEGPHSPILPTKEATPQEKTDILSDKMTKGMSPNRFRPKIWQKEDLRHGKNTFGTDFEIS